MTREVYTVMELGKITRSYLTKREVTSDVISSLADKNKDGAYYSDTLSLVRVFSVHHAEFGHFYVSPLVQRYNGSNKPKAVMSLSKFQKVYSEQGYFADDGDVLLKPIYDYLLNNKPDEDNINFFFENPVTISAQTFADFGERRVTSYYHIIGVSLDRIQPR